MTNALVTQLLEALLASSVNEDNLAQTTEAITAAREYLATEPSGERAELIARLAKRSAKALTLFNIMARA